MLKAWRRVYCFTPQLTGCVTFIGVASQLRVYVSVPHYNEVTPFFVQPPPKGRPFHLHPTYITAVVMFVWCLQSTHHVLFQNYCWMRDTNAFSEDVRLTVVFRLALLVLIACSQRVAFMSSYMAVLSSLYLHVNMPLRRASNGNYSVTGLSLEHHHHNITAQYSAVAVQYTYISPFKTNVGPCTS